MILINILIYCICHLKLDDQLVIRLIYRIIILLFLDATWHMVHHQMGYYCVV